MNAPAAAAAPATPGEQKKPVDFAALEAREARGLKPQSFASKDGKLHATIQAVAAPKIEESDQSLAVTVSIGSGAPIACFIYNQDVKVGLALSNVLASIGEDGKTKIVKVSVDDVDVMAGAGAAYATGVYQTIQNGEPAIGTLKMFFHGSFEHGVMCLHDEIGYRHTFADVTRQLVDSIKFPSELGKPRLVEVARYRVGGAPVGFAQTMLVDMPNGITIDLSLTTRVVRVAEAEFTTSDSVEIVGLDEQRRVLNGKFEDYDGREPTLAIELKRTADNKYHYEGTTHQKPIAGELKTTDKKGLVSSGGHDLQIVELVKAKQKKTLKFERYDPSEDPTRVESVSVDVDGATHKAKAKYGSVGVDLDLDDDGFSKGGHAHIGKIELVMERLFRKGAP